MKQAFIDTLRRELREFSRRPRYVVLLTLGLVFSYTFFLTLMHEGQPAKLPIAIVDHDGSYLSRRLCHEIEATQGVHIVAVYDNHAQARAAMQRQEIFAFYEIPENIYADLLAFKSPRISLYASNAYLMPGSFSYKSLATIGKLAAAAVQREVLRKKGYPEKQIMGIIQPVELDTHPVSNAETSYQPYVLTTVLPGILGVMTLLFTVYKVSDERKRRTMADWMRTAQGNVPVALAAKLLPYALWFSLLGILGNIILFYYARFTLLGSFFALSLMVVLLVLAQQAMGVFLAALIPEQHLSISVAAIYGMLSFTMSGFSYPVTNMPPFLQAVSYLFPLRHYYLGYVDIALYGNGVAYYWPVLVGFAVFLLLGMAGAVLLSRETRCIRAGICACSDSSNLDVL
ncbi:MAG: ABC-2 Type Transporter [bacterium P3]|nr:MAG: ABC-2 Type Transporter [bacterium P201]KWW30506.1 MAG: ABC-2 Type Transporter [bacterium P3]KWW41393.1 MAG: ABC-2 Type Transporter [bacterium F083]